MGDERLDRVRNANHYYLTVQDVKDVIAAYDDLRSTRDKEIQEAVRLARGNLQTTISLDERPEETDEDVSFNDGLHTAIDRITQRGPALDPDTIRREAAEAERGEIGAEVAKMEPTEDDEEYIAGWTDCIVNVLDSISKRGGVLDPVTTRRETIKDYREQLAKSFEGEAPAVFTAEKVANKIRSFPTQPKSKEDGS